MSHIKLALLNSRKNCAHNVTRSKRFFKCFKRVWSSQELKNKNTDAKRPESKWLVLNHWNYGNGYFSFQSTVQTFTGVLPLPHVASKTRKVQLEFLVWIWSPACQSITLVKDTRLTMRHDTTLAASNLESTNSLVKTCQRHLIFANYVIPRRRVDSSFLTHKISWHIE